MKIFKTGPGAWQSALLKSKAMILLFALFQVNSDLFAT